MPPESFRTIPLFGELDLHSARELASTLSAAVGDVTCEPVVDLRRVTFMDSTVLGALVRAGEQMRNQGRALKLVVVAGQVTEVLAVSGLTERFELLSVPPGTARGSTGDPAAAA